MRILYASLLLVGCTLIGAGLGATVGVINAQFIPDFYSELGAFDGGLSSEDPRPSPATVAARLGAAQGGISGFLCGLGIAALVIARMNWSLIRKNWGVLLMAALGGLAGCLAPQWLPEFNLFKLKVPDLMGNAVLTGLILAWAVQSLLIAVGVAAGLAAALLVKHWRSG